MKQFVAETFLLLVPAVFSPIRSGCELTLSFTLDVLFFAYLYNYLFWVDDILTQFMFFQERHLKLDIHYFISSFLWGRLGSLDWTGLDFGLKCLGSCPSSHCLSLAKHINVFWLIVRGSWQIPCGLCNRLTSTLEE